MKNLAILLLFVFSYSTAQTITISEDESRKFDKFDMEKLMLKRDSIRKLDFFSYNYEYLDSNYKIIMPKDTFELAVERSGIYKERIRNYRDSILVVMSQRFTDQEMANMASRRIAYSWERLSYHIWKTEKESKTIARDFGFTHPYQFKEFLIDDSIKTEKKTRLFDELKDNIKATTGKKMKLETYDSTLNYALKNNPIIIEANSKHRN